MTHDGYAPSWTQESERERDAAVAELHSLAPAGPCTKFHTNPRPQFGEICKFQNLMIRQPRIAYVATVSVTTRVQRQNSGKVPASLRDTEPSLVPEIASGRFWVMRYSPVDRRVKLLARAT